MHARSPQWLRERRAWPALLAALVLALQMWIPGAAYSANAQAAHAACADEASMHAGAQGMHAMAGAKAPDHKRTPFGGLACEQCVIASLAALTAPPPVLVRPGEAVRHAQPPLPPADTLPPARAPPKPYSQGPPLLS